MSEDSNYIYCKRSVELFDINEIKITSKNYGAVQTYAMIEPEDEKEVLNWISDLTFKDRAKTTSTDSAITNNT
jgi:hypothetical protein